MCSSDLRKLIGSAIPDATEVISYQMPGYKLNGMVCWYAAFKEHISLFIPPTYQIPFLKELKAFDCSKSGIRIPYGDPIPELLFTNMVKHAAKSTLNKAKKKNVISGKSKADKKPQAKK